MITIPTPSQDEIDERFDLAVDLHKEYLLSPNGEMYPFSAENQKEAIEQTEDSIMNFKDGSLNEIIQRYWKQCAAKKAFDVVQKNFDPLNMR